MSEQMFMYATTAGFMIGLAVILFVSRGRRVKEIKPTISEDRGKKVKYDSNGRPVSE